MFKKILAGIIIAIVFLWLGIFIGTKIIKKAVTQCATVKAGDTYQAGWDAAKKRLQAYMGTASADAVEVKNVHGTIQKIDSNKLTVKIRPFEPLADQDLDTRIITVDANTKITLAVQKDQAQLDHKYITLSDLKENQEISATASENIKDKKEFTAILIDTQEAIIPASVPVVSPVAK